MVAATSVTAAPIDELIEGKRRASGEPNLFVNSCGQGIPEGSRILGVGVDVPRSRTHTKGRGMQGRTERSFMHSKENSVSDSARPEVAAFSELEQLVKHLGDELASFRRRALQAEARLKSLESTGVKGVMSPERVQYLERENAGLTTRLDAARARTQQMIDRVRFLRQQHDGAAAR